MKILLREVKTTSFAKPKKASEIISKARTPLTKSRQDQVLKRDECCQYQNKQTGKVCGSKWRLNIDHVQPIWAEGSNEIQNLRVLCANHNLQIYRDQARLIRKY